METSGGGYTTDAETVLSVIASESVTTKEAGSIVAQTGRLFKSAAQ